jgi:guanylate kinase
MLKKNINIQKQVEKKVIVITAPSGGGKTTLGKHLLKEIPFPHLGFSVSATNREKRDGEIHGVNYWFHPLEQIKQMIDGNEFLEYEEVYPGKFYGTPASEIERITRNGNHVLLDVDIAGAISIKKRIPNAKVIFINPPSVEILIERLKERKDTSQEDIDIRIQKAPIEIEMAHEMLGKGIFDASVLNDDLPSTKKTILNLVKLYLGMSKKKNIKRKIKTKVA